MGVPGPLRPSRHPGVAWGLFQSTFASLMIGEASIIPILYVKKYKSSEVNGTKQRGSRTAGQLTCPLRPLTFLPHSPVTLQKS